ncbi:glycosyltransferase family 4 protein [Polymorphospora rubra]|uniref:Glycosyl transferase n=1 Tax=Polymorphospora rubra TaxID=338584 RepID=A0A810MZK7_9ACTN|nr:glycosyltransferase family 4 protein [Polymorphospora rubra]BCJ66567.1 glycosyl transferase [Polymorphospora rubra]
MVVPPWYELPPPGYGGLEQVVSALVDGLAALGHDVTLFGAGSGTGTAAEFVGTDQLQNSRLGQALPELAHVARTNRMIADGDFDIVHDHTTIGPLAASRRETPTVATVHGAPVGELADILKGVDPQVALVAISHSQRALVRGLPWVATVHNAMAGSGVSKPAPSDGPVVWLARFSPDKGPDLAIEAAREAGLPLVLAGKCTEPGEAQYLAEVIEPMLGPDVTLLRNPERETCAELLLRARCLIMPIRWSEPFGMVMLEAMSAGTPVVALNRGAVPELVRHGETGFVHEDPAELPQSLRDVLGLDPAACVEHVRTQFGADRMARAYERVYRRWVSNDRSAPLEREMMVTSAT